jgi:hypothetical protein
MIALTYARGFRPPVLKVVNIVPGVLTPVLAKKSVYGRRI